MITSPPRRPLPDSPEQAPAEMPEEYPEPERPLFDEPAGEQDDGREENPEESPPD